jgi:hypothetical protein
MTTEQSFRNNLSQFRWARGVTDDSQQAQPVQPSANPFSRFYNAVAGDYVPLRSSERSNEDEAWFALSRWERYVHRSDSADAVVTLDRLLGFGACLIGACVCFFFAFLGLPWLPIRPAKFALAFRCASSSLPPALIHPQSAWEASLSWSGKSRPPPPSLASNHTPIQLLGAHRTHKPHQTPRVQRTTALLGRLPGQLGSHPLLCPRGKHPLHVFDVCLDAHALAPRHIHSSARCWPASSR